MEFSKMGDSQFPYIDNLKTRENDFDYSKWENVNMTIRCLNVPWDMGEVHVGNRTVSGIGNVVKFENDDARNKWFNEKKYAYTPEQAQLDNYDGFEWDTQFRTFHNEDEIFIPLPFDVAAQFNYLTISYNRAPIDYERDNSILKWFYFSRAVEEISPNKTKCIIKRDTWQTYINRVQIPWMILQQGHAPLFAASNVENFLSNPIDNTAYLLADDVSYGDLAKVKYIDSANLNEKAVAVIVTSSIPQGEWGLKSNNTWTTPSRQGVQDGVLAYRAFAIDTDKLTSFLYNAETNTPQFIQTIKGVFFINPDLITYHSTFEFCNTECRLIDNVTSTINLIDIQKNQFGYNAKYSNLTKLYTFPYAALEITNEDGNSTIVKIEETSGNLALKTAINLAYPFINIDGRLSGVGGNATKTLTFKNISSKDFKIDGRWCDFLYKWEIPVFGVYQSASIQNDYAEHYQRLQRALENATTNTNALASNSTANTNALASNSTANTNALASNSTANSNALASNSTANTNALGSNATANDNVKETNTATNLNAADTRGTNTLNATNAESFSNAAVTTKTQYNKALTAWDNYLAAYGTALSANQAMATTANNIASGAVSTLVQGASSGAMAGGAIGLAAGIGGGLAGVATNAYFANAANVITMANDQNLLDANILVNETKNGSNSLEGLNNELSRLLTENENAFRNATTNLNNVLNSQTTTRSINASNANADRTKTTADANANRTKTTADANANRTKTTSDANANRTKTTADENANRTKTTADENANRTKNTADAGIIASINAAGLRAPIEYGTYSNGENATTKPRALIANVITQSDDAITMAGDKFLRYGYNWQGNWNFETFNIMPKFTYWQVSDMWVKGLDVPDLYMDEIRFFLLGGVTVWRNPEDIGNVSIYENI